MNIWPHCSRAGRNIPKFRILRREKYSPAPAHIDGGSASPAPSASLVPSPETKRNCNSKKKSYMAGWQTWWVQNCFHVRNRASMNERLTRKGSLGICRCQLCRAGQVPARGDGHRTRALSCASLFSCWSLHILSGSNSEGSGRTVTAPFPTESQRAFREMQGGKEEWKACSAFCAHYLKIIAH